ncbi:hypothetical protein ACFC26_44180 [Kitasatospora purpeofusca]|uniref:hypothetical protein n=1 Tax=Kitasatospora purpeofusca TaxID=67352 RepID=UPI0035D6DBE8
MDYVEQLAVELAAADPGLPLAAAVDRLLASPAGAEILAALDRIAAAGDSVTPRAEPADRPAAARADTAPRRR